jgi:diacylglycerol O-acyltransferase / wax synthase
VTKPSCWTHARPSLGIGWIQRDRCGSCGCCPVCRRGGWACTSGCHHGFADGAAALAAFGALLNLTPGAPTPVAPPWTPSPIPTSDDLLSDNLHRRRQELGHGWSGLIHPNRTLRSARQAWPAWREVLAERPAPRTSLNRPVGAGRRLALVRGRLDLAKQIAHEYDAKVNDVVLAAVAGGLRELLAGRGEDVRGLVQRVMVTISLHEEQSWEAQGNKPGVDDGAAAARRA